MTNTNRVAKSKKHRNESHSPTKRKESDTRRKEHQAPPNERESRLLFPREQLCWSFAT
jgi:hypothetical protein